MKSYLANYRQSPRKVRLIADLVRGKKVDLAIQELTFTFKRASAPMVKVIKSAISNAVHNDKANPEALFIKEIQVNKGLVMKRMMPRARGSSAQILKRTSHISVILGEKTVEEMAKKVKKSRAQKRETKKRSANKDGGRRDSAESANNNK